MSIFFMSLFVRFCDCILIDLCYNVFDICAKGGDDMKKYIPYILAFLLLGCAVLFLMIRSDRYEYHSQEITYSEPDVQYGFRISMDCTETAYARYYFEPTIDQTERSLCIGKTDTILERAAILGCTPEIYIFTSERYPHTFISDHSLFS